MIHKICKMISASLSCKAVPELDSDLRPYLALGLNLYYGIKLFEIFDKSNFL
jgi:hypothetical protein